MLFRLIGKKEAYLIKLLRLVAQVASLPCKKLGGLKCQSKLYTVEQRKKGLGYS